MTTPNWCRTRPVPPVLVGDLGAIHWCQGNGVAFWADYSLNILNPVSLDRLRKWGAQGACASPELELKTAQRISRIYAAVELLVYGEVVLMVSQTCALYETLEDNPKCSHWCRRDQYYIQDEKGYRFPVQGDADCRFYVFNSRTLSMLG
ncbi:MAG: U32 family peptidase [Syntrophomonadaceae bacterium]